jgi:hypothetical protein
MSRIIHCLPVFLAFAVAAEPAQAAWGGCQDGCLGGNGGFLGIELDLDGDLDLDLDLGTCFDLDLGLGAACALVADVDADLYCDPLSVEAACIAELGVDCGVEAFAACVVDMTAHCAAEIEAGGALFCDGLFVGADGCFGGLLGALLDIDACFDVDLDVDVDLDLGVCHDVELDADVECGVEVDAACAAKCTPAAVEAACVAELGLDCDLHAFAACQVELIADCVVACELDGAAFCDGEIYVGAGSCI